MELDRGTRTDAGNGLVSRKDPTITPPPGMDAASSSSRPPIGPDVSTPLLRRCTALAAQARVELLTAGRHTASDELEGILATLESWDPAMVAQPDRTMVVLAAASLQDLDERLPQSGRPVLAERTAAALAVLHQLMSSGHIGAMA